MRSVIVSIAFVLCFVFLAPSPAQARHHRHYQHAAQGSGEIVAHPAGCPRNIPFCGCGTAVQIFGAPIRSLWLAANWLRFPRTAPAPGMVAVRKHHVFAILELRGHGRVLAYDANSGGHRTRIHERSIAGFTIVNPHGRHA